MVGRRAGKTVSVLLAACLGLAALAPARPAAAYGPDGFVLPRPGEGEERMPGGPADLRYWSWSELGPATCPASDPRVHVRIGGQFLAVPCADFIDATISQGRPPESWGTRSDPVRASAVSAVLRRAPDVMLTYGERPPAARTFVRRVREALAGAGCTPIGEDLMRCPQPDWPASRFLVVSSRAADTLPSGTRLAVECETRGRLYCALYDAGRGGDLTLEAAFDAPDPAALAGFRDWSAEAVRALAAWRP